MTGDGGSGGGPGEAKNAPARAAGDRTEGGTFDAKLSVGKEGDAVAELGEVNKSPPLSCKQSL